MPVLSAGPHFSHNPGSSTGGSLTSLFRLNNKPKQQEGPPRRRRYRQEHNMDSWTPRTGGRDIDTTPPNSRPRVRKMPSMLGMLQNAQDQAASPPGDGESSATAAISDGGATGGNDLAGHQLTSRRIGVVDLGGGREASRRNPTPVPAAAVVNKGRERSPLPSLPISRTPTVDHEEAPRLVGTLWRLRQISVRIIQRLPGPKLLMQVSPILSVGFRRRSQVIPERNLNTTYDQQVFEVHHWAIATRVLWNRCFRGGQHTNRAHACVMDRKLVNPLNTLCKSHPTRRLAFLNKRFIGDSILPIRPFVLGPPPRKHDSSVKTLATVLGEAIDPKNVRLTTQSEPVILMEVMPAALVISLLALTYLVFASSVFLIVWFHLRGTTTLAVGPGSGEGAAELCARRSSSTVTITTSGGEGDVFIIGAHGPDPHSPSAAGCTVFSPGLSGLSLDSPILSSSSSTSSSLTDAEERLAENRGYTLFNFYQNQDTIWGQALVRQYRVQVCSHPVSGRFRLSLRAFAHRHHPWIVHVGFVSTTASSSSTGGSSDSAEESFSWVSEAMWSLEYESGATTEWEKIVLAVLLMCWVPVWLAWCLTVFYKSSERGFKNAWHERKWLSSLGLSVVFYLNPIKVVGNFASPESASWDLTSEMCFSVAAVFWWYVSVSPAGWAGTG
ncbi:unnamed protein product [Ectocarpus sp. CCAP 1310/34]|nr:unnamed protein product [Ectocarpus sp. CCAP 1310/34]